MNSPEVETPEEPEGPFKAEDVEPSKEHREGEPIAVLQLWLSDDGNVTARTKLDPPITVGMDVSTIPACHQVLLEMLEVYERYRQAKRQAVGPKHKPRIIVPSIRKPRGKA
jgi:hypothetical protein